MPTHDYSPRRALNLLLSRMDGKYPELFHRIKEAIDAGKDMQAEQPAPRRRGRRPAVRSYRKNVPYTDEEAIAVTLAVLRSHLIESRRMIDAADMEFTKAEVAPPKPREESGADKRDIAESRTSGKDKAKEIEIEEEPETVLEKQSLPNVSLRSARSTELEGLEQLFRRLGELTTFH